MLILVSPNVPHVCIHVSGFANRDNLGLYIKSHCRRKLAKKSY